VIWAAKALAALVVLYVVALMYLAGQPVLASAVLGLAALAGYVFSSRRTYAGRYLFPGLVGIGVFVVLPLVYTMWIGFTNYSSSNILTLERATAALLSKTVRTSDESYLFTLHQEGDQLRLVLQPEGSDEPAAPDEGEGSGAGSPGSGDGSGDAAGEDEGSIFDEEPDAAVGAGEDAGPMDAAGPGDAAAGDAGAGDAGAGAAAAPVEPVVPVPAQALPSEYITPPFRLDGGTISLTATPYDAAKQQPPLSPALELRQIIEQQAALARISVALPSGTKLVNAGLRTFAAEAPLYLQGAGGRLTDQLTGAVYLPNHDIGFYQTASGERLTPGFRVFVAGKNFARIFTESSFRGPFLRIFLWTVSFAGLSVLFTLVVGSLLAELFSWEGLRFRGLYRVLLFIPYAVPSFISIQVFKGLFNQNVGEINLILQTFFGISPHWFSDVWLARTMILIVNTWLGYPYMMLLCMGLRQSIPKDLYEASALAGAGPFTNYFKITWPLIRRPLVPLLIASFAFNFNNFVLMSLLTGGRPDMIGAQGPAGTNDILVSYTYRLAFEDSGKNYALAAAISTVIFFLVAGLAFANLRLTKINSTKE
jgi:maltose/maltodextrin transport system permease protein